MTKSGLQDIAEELAVARIGQAHQAGSDSLLTGQVYFKMKEKIFNGTIEEDKYRLQVWGLNAQMPTGGGPNIRDFSTPNMERLLPLRQAILVWRVLHIHLWPMA